MQADRLGQTRSASLGIDLINLKSSGERVTMKEDWTKDKNCEQHLYMLCSQSAWQWNFRLIFYIGSAMVRNHRCNQTRNEEESYKVHKVRIHNNMALHWRPQVNTSFLKRVTERVTLEMAQNVMETTAWFIIYGWIAHYNFLKKKIFSIHGHACLATAVSNSSPSAFRFHICLVCNGSQGP